MPIEQTDDVTEFRFVTNRSFVFSVNVEKSDNLLNQAVLNNLIATLVKFDHAGRLTPFLSESWVESSNGLTWTFKIRPNYRSEDGELITSEKFGKALIKALKNYSESKPDFWAADLLGWEELKSKSPERFDGLDWDEDSIYFYFRRKPDNLLNYLRMPYFGYWGAENRENKFISSGPYRLVELTDKQVSLELRGEFCPNDQKCIRKVRYSVGEISKTDLLNEKIIALITNSEELDLSAPGIKKFYFPPDILSTLILSPDGLAELMSEKDRVELSQSLKAALLDWQLPPGSVRTQTFYPTNNQAIDKMEILKISKRIPRPLRVLVSSRWENEMDSSAESLVLHFLKESQIPFQVFRESDLTEDLATRIYTNDYFDLRFSSVVSGPKFIKSVAKMMFCSRMGVSFPDPNRSVCKLLENESIQGEEFVEKINSIVDREGYIIPYARMSWTIYYSPKINLEKYPAGSPYILFSNLREID